VRQSNAQVTGFYKRLGYTEEPVVVMGARFIRDE
jgi:ribosomal protein S18 acetylase RimI-like enzyme